MEDQPWQKLVYVRINTCNTNMSKRLLQISETLSVNLGVVKYRFVL